MDRTSKKAREIAWDILGKPANMIHKKSRKQKKRDREIDISYSYNKPFRG